MSYCPKCGNKVEETNSFCPNCGTALKITALSQPAPECVKQEKQENYVNPTLVETPKKNQYGSVNYLISGLILIVIGVFAIIYLTSHFLATGQTLALMLITVGIIIISGAVYVYTPAEKFFQRLISHPKNSP
jgi:uncharacterized membrane protein YvbJ